MHGRVKVRTTAEQEKIKEAEKQKKAAEFKKGVEFVFQKRKNQEWDDEILCITEKLLVKYPDVYTLWNIRREAFIKNEWTEDERIVRLEKELTLTELSLRENPKSYYVWNQRVWILEQLPKPNYKRELELCNKCLNLDERNFHCWDYRLFIVKKANIPDEEELEFTNTKIMNNFSNYSSWHYRSRLLKKLYPSNVYDLPIKADKHDQELDLVMNATFTDPNDSSAWFYQRWLLDHKKSPSNLWRVVLTENTLIASFHKEVSLDFELIINNKKIQLDWKSANDKKFCPVWYSVIENYPTNDVEDEIIFKINEKLYNLIKLDSINEWICKGETLIKNQNDVKLNEQLNNYKMLLQMEPLNKWAKLTSTHLMLNIDSIKFYSDIMKELKDLTTVDPLRENYYKDMRSKCSLEYRLNDISSNNDKTINLQSLDLSNLELTTISSQEQYLAFFHDINLSNNQFENKLGLFYTLRRCKKLNLSNNATTSLINFPKLKNLKTLLLSDNQISDSKMILDFLNEHDLETIDLKGNPISDLDLLIGEINKLYPNLKVIV